MDEPFKPEFDVQYQGRARAIWRGPKDPATLVKLFEFFRKEKWRGRLEVQYPGNGGINEIAFDEVRRASENGKENGEKGKL